MAKSSNSTSATKMTDEEAILHDNTISPRDDRRERGKALRAAIPHEVHAGWRAPDNRPNPLDLLAAGNEGRLSELIPIRWGRMLQSPFTFYRGSAALMAWDLSNLPSTKIRVQACGDCHLLNFGAFATPERNVVFDINDFDETLPAPWEWDLKRLAVSFVLAARENGLKPKFESAAVEAVARAYRENISEFARMSILDIWYHRIDFDKVIERTTCEELQKHRKDRLKQAVHRTIQDYYFPKLTEQVGGGRRIKDNPPVIFHKDSEDGKAFDKRIRDAFTLYKESLQDDRRRLFDRYKMEDVAIKVVGIGSVGTMCAVALMLAPDDEPLFLQIKEARRSVLEDYLGKSSFDNHGQRVVAGQRIVQSASDIFLGWTQFDNGRHFYIRQLRDTKVKPEPELWEGPQLVESAEVMGAVLAKAHARSGDAAIIKGYLGTKDTFDRALMQFALPYADQTEKDHALLVEAVRSGKIKATVDTVKD
ncbi:MAG: DUF2252 domain-containing protein [Candidatus Obscuribacterales bacterium]|nr:DUF2252 domain-containing protein [Candidatus Obscuribacterales bacterium]